MGSWGKPGGGQSGQSKSWQSSWSGRRTSSSKERENPSRSKDGFRKGFTQDPVQESKKLYFDFLLLIMSLIVGTACAFGARFLYNKTLEIFPARPFVIMAVFGAFDLVFSLIMYLVRKMQGKMRGSTSWKCMRYVLLVPLAALALGGVFEFIYELGIHRKVTEPTSYVFLIDDSDSMKSSDPGFERYSAIVQVMEATEPGFPYAVYSFNTYSGIIRNMAPRENQVPDMRDRANVTGGTEMKLALENVLADIKDDPAGGESPRVLLLSDGFPTDIERFRDVRSLMAEYNREGITISSIGMGTYVDEELMTKIAESTGGVYRSVMDLADLSGSMQSAVSDNTGRDLFSTRMVLEFDWVYTIERIVFLALLGTLIGLSMIVKLNIFYLGMQAVLSPVKALIGAALVELMLRETKASPQELIIIYFVLCALVFCRYKRYSSGSSKNWKKAGPEETDGGTKAVHL